MSSIIFGIGGGAGTGIDPTFTTLALGQVPKADGDGKLIYGSITDDLTSRLTTFDNSVAFPAGSADVGPTLRLSEGAGDLVIADLLNDQMSFSVNSDFTDATGSSLPAFFDFGGPFNSDINLDDTQVLTTNPLDFSITGAADIPDVTLVDRATIKTNGAMTNASLRVTDNATGKVVRYIPSKAAWDGIQSGLSLGGPLEITFYFAEEGTDTATEYYFGYVPFLVENGQQLDFSIKGDSVDLLGEIGGTPYLVLEVHDGPPVPLAREELANRPQTTGLLSGGVITQASGTTVGWTAGTGQVADFSSPTSPVATIVSWDAVAGLTPTNIAIDGITIFGYDSAGALTEKLGTAVAFVDSVDFIFIGAVQHVSGAIIEVFDAPANLAYNGPASFFNFANFVIGPANVAGNVYGANGANLAIDVIGGPAFILGSNFRTDTKLPDIVTLASVAGLSFYKVYRDADPGLGISYDGAQTTSIDPTQYDDGSGTLATVTAGFWTIPRIFRNREGSTFVAYGQQEFASQALALEALGSEPFQEKNPLPFDLYRCSLVVSQAATDLSNTAQAEFFAQASFRSGGAVGSSSTIPGVTSPGGIDSSLQFNNGGAFGGDTNFLYDSTLKTVVLKSVPAGSATYEFIDSSDDVKATVKYSEGADQFSIDVLNGLSELYLNTAVIIHRGTIDGRIDVEAQTAVGSALVTLSTAAGGTGLSLEFDDAADESNIIGEVGHMTIGTDGSGTNLTLSPDGGVGIKIDPTAGYNLDVYAAGTDIVGLYSSKAVTLEVGAYGSSESINLIFNKGDVGTDQSEFVMFNNNHSTESTRYFRMGYADEIATQGGLTFSDANNFIGIGTRTDPDSPLHIYQNDTETGDQAGLTIEQDGAGDAIAQFLLSGGQRWVMGISNAGGDAFEIASSINLGSDTRLVINTTGEVKITDSLMVGSVSNPVSPLHVYEDTANTDATAGITIEQDNIAGDAVLHYVFTGIQTWSTGADISGSGHYKISGSDDLSTGAVLTATIAGRVGIGSEAPTSTLTVYDDSTFTGSTIGLTIEQDGTGDALAQWHLTGGTRYLAGIDNSDSDIFKIANGGFLPTDAAIQINTDNEVGVGGAPLAGFIANLEGKLVVQNHTEMTSTNTPYGGRGQVQNRLKYSQELDNAVWVPGSTDEPVVTANNAIAPDGTMTADTLSFPGPGAGLIRQGTLGLIEDDTYNVSGWVRHVSGGTQLTARLDTDNVAAWITDSRWQRFSSDIVQGSGGPWFDLFVFAAHAPAVFEVWGLQVSDGAGDKPYLKTEETALLTATTGMTSSGTAYIKGAREVATNGPEVVEVWSLDDMPRVGGTGDVIPEYKLYRFMQGIDWGTTRLKLENDAYALFEGTDVFVTSQTYSGTDPWIYGEGTIRCVGNGMTWQINSDNSTMFDITAGGWGMDYSSLIAAGDNCSLGTIVSPAVTDPLLGARFISTRSLFQGFKTGLTLVQPGNIHIDISFFYDAADAVGPMISVIGMGKAGVIESTEVTMASANSDFIYISPITEAPVTCMNVTLADEQSFFQTGTTGAITLFADASVPAETVTSVTDSAGTARFNFTAPPTLYVGQSVVMSTFTNYDNGTFIVTATGANYFEVGTDYNGADTGSFLSDSVTVTSVAHGLSEGGAVLITDTMEYNYGSTIYNVQTDTYQVNLEWDTAETSGTWNDGSLDHSSKYVNSFNNGQQQDSNTAPSFNVADNATTTTTTTSWGAVVFGTAGVALVAGNTNQNFTLLDDITGLIRYEGIDPLSIKLTPSISMLKTGGSVEHQFRLFKTTGTPAFDPHTVKRSISTVTGAASLNCSAFLNPGDEFRLEVKATATGSTITLTDFSL